MKFKTNLQLFTDKGEKGDTDTGVDNEEIKDETKEDIKDETKEEKTMEELLTEKLLEKEKEWQSETDRRVNQALEKQKRLSELSEEEKLKELEKERKEELEIRERELNIKTARLDIFEALKDADLLDAEHIFKAENYQGDNKENLEEDIKILQEFITNKVEKEVQAEKDELLRGGAKPGQNSNKKDSLVVGDFEKMNYMEKLELYNTNKELYKQLRK